MGELRAILARGASSETFEELCACYPEGEMPDEVVTYLLGHLRRWPDEVRRRVPTGWMRQVEEGKACRAVRLCNALWIEGRRGYMQRFNKWCRCEEVEQMRELVIDSRGERYQIPARLLHTENFTGLETFCARGVELWSSKERDAISRGPLFQGVKTLFFEDVHDKEGVAHALFSTPPELEQVRVVDLFGQGMEAFLGLLEREHVPARLALRALKARYALDEHWMRRAIQSGGLSQIRELELVSVPIDARERVNFFAQMTRLERLDRRGAFESNADVAAWCDGLYDAPLKACHVGSMDISTEAIERIFSVPWRLEEFVFHSRGWMEGDAAECISQMPSASTLRRLELRHCGLEDESCEALASSPWLDGLERLDLRHNAISEEGAQALLLASFARNLLELDLEENLIDDRKTQQKVWRLPGLEEVEKIFLMDEVLDGAFWEELCHAPWVSSVAHMRFELVRWQGDPVFEPLLEAREPERTFRALRTLAFFHGELPARALEVLTRWPAMKRVRELQLHALWRDTPCDPEWFEALGGLLRAESLQRVEVLDLSGNAFGTSKPGVEALLEGLKGWRGDRLRWLSLKDCQLERRDLRRLTEVSCLGGLKVLVLQGNAFDGRVVEQLRAHFPGVRIEHQPPHDDAVFIERGMLVEPEPQEFDERRSRGWEEWEI